MWDAGQLVYGFVKDLGKFFRHEVTVHGQYREPGEPSKIVSSTSDYV